MLLLHFEDFSSLIVSKAQRVIHQSNILQVFHAGCFVHVSFIASVYSFGNRLLWDTKN